MSEKILTAMYRLMGEALNEFNCLEDSIRYCIINIVRLYDGNVMNVFLGQLSYNQLVDVFNGLAVLTMKEKDPLRKELDRLTKELKDRALERNKLVHSVWGLQHSSGDRTGIIRMKYSRPGKQERVAMWLHPASEGELRDWIAKTNDTTDKVEEFTKTVFSRNRTPWSMAIHIENNE